MADQNNRHPFQRLQTQLAELIAGTRAGDRLLSEPDLARKLGVSRATLREAMRTFEGQGLIRRRQGVGTFVVANPHVIETGLEVLESIETLSSKIHLDVTLGALKIEHVVADDMMSEIFQVESGTPLLKVLRVSIAENRPVAYLIDTLPLEILDAKDLDEGFTGSVLDFLLRRGAVRPVNAKTEIQAVAAPADIARSLQIQRGDVLLMFTTKLYTSDGRIIDFSYSYFLPGYFRFHVVRRVEGLSQS
jgi:GntR family transcriptional regulator